MTVTAYRCPHLWEHGGHNPRFCPEGEPYEVEPYVGPPYAIHSRSDAEHPPPPPHPAPEVVARRANVEEIPRGAQAVVNLAERNGWTVRALYARGTAPGRAAKVVDLVALQIQGDTAFFVATWEDGKARSCWQVRPELKEITVTALKEMLG